MGIIEIVSVAGGAVGALFGGGGFFVAMRGHGIAEHQQWMDDAKDAYTRLEKDSERCNRKLDRVLTGLYRLLEDIEEQVIPMLQLPNVDPAGTRAALRTSIRTMRDVLIERDMYETG
jgi:hypothetical protein